MTRNAQGRECNVFYAGAEESSSAPFFGEKRMGLSLVMDAADLASYLSPCRFIDFDTAAIREKGDELFAGLVRADDKIEAAFAFVRDGIRHSGDIDSSVVTKTASEVLLQGEGICMAKSFLLAALLRYGGIPAGLCYQRLTRGDTADTGYVLHGLNAVYMETLEHWVRLDARGNKAGVDVRFSPREDGVAFPVRPECGEIDYPVIYARPHPEVARALASYDDRRRQEFGVTEL